MIGLVKRIGCGMGDDADLRSQTQKIDSILPLEIGDRHELPLFPKQTIGKARDVAHMDARADDAPALADRLQRQGDETTHDRKDDCGIERVWRHLVRSARPGGAQPPGESLCGKISRPREGKHRSPLPLRDLSDDVGSGAKAVEP